MPSAASGLRFSTSITSNSSDVVMAERDGRVILHFGDGPVVFDGEDDFTQSEYINNSWGRMTPERELGFEERNRRNRMLDPWNAGNYWFQHEAGPSIAGAFSLLTLEANVALVRGVEAWHMSLPLTPGQTETARRVARELVQQAYQAMDKYETGRQMSESERSWGQPLWNDALSGVTHDFAYYDFMGALARLL